MVYTLEIQIGLSPELSVSRQADAENAEEVI